MTNTAQATAASHEVKIGTRTFRMSPLRDKDYGEFEAWVQDQYLAVVKRNLDGLRKDERQRQLDRAFEHAAMIGISSPEALAAMCTIEGVGMLIWLSVRREHPDVDRDEIVSLMTSEEHVRSALDSIDHINHIRGGKAQNPKVRTARRRNVTLRTRRYRRRMDGLRRKLPS